MQQARIATKESVMASELDKVKVFGGPVVSDITFWNRFTYGSNASLLYVAKS